MFKHAARRVGRPVVCSSNLPANAEVLQVGLLVVLVVLVGDAAALNQATIVAGWRAYIMLK
jgi:hypothetical protein